MDARNGDKVIAGSTNSTALNMTDRDPNMKLTYIIEVASTSSGIQFQEGAVASPAAARTVALGNKLMIKAKNGNLYFKASNANDYFYVTLA